MTGEVVTGTEERLATGDAVNVAARLEQAAQPGEVLVGETTLALVRGVADVEPIERLEVKGKSDAVPAFRLLSVRDMPERPHGERFVGRERELAILEEVWKRVQSEHRCELVTVVGEAGVGKSRLATEGLASIDATVVSGRCPPYWLDENEPPVGRNYLLRAYRAGALAMLGRFDEARAILAEARVALAERGGGVQLAVVTGFLSVSVELWARDPAAAYEFGAAAFGLWEDLGELSALSTAAGDVAQSLYALERLDEADAWAGRTAELGASDDASSEMLWRQVRAKVLARRGEHAKAEQLARQAVAIGAKTDALNDQGDANADLAEVLLLGGRANDAAVALTHALECYERKRNVVMAGRMRDRLAAVA